MKYKGNEVAYMREYDRQRWLNNAQFREAKKERAKKARRRNAVYIEQVRSESTCGVCGEGRWQVLEFHHRDPGSKLFNISEANDVSLKTLQREIEKCDILCANCHRMLEWEKRQGVA